MFPSLPVRRRTVLTHALIAVLAAWGIAFLVYAARFWNEIPVLTAETFAQQQSVIVTDRTGQELIRFHEGHDVVEITAQDMPEHLREAFIAIEDRRFFLRPCVDVRALTRASIATVFGKRIEGASTITQQLVGLLLENRNERTIRRKVNELLLACKLEWTMPKEDILTLYLNRVPFGGNVYGVEQASQTFFGVHAHDLSVAQAAVLASLPQRPTALSPYGKLRHSLVSPQAEMLIARKYVTEIDDLPEGSWQMGLLPLRIQQADGTWFTVPGRTDVVLEQMNALGFIGNLDRADADTDLRRLRFREQIAAEPDAQYFVRQIRTSLPSLLQSTDELKSRQWSGIKIRTTLDRKLQNLAEQLIARHAEEYRVRFGVENLSLVAIDRQTREVVAYVGNAPTATGSGSEVDMASVPRQPGSSFKPFVYAAAFSEGKLKPESRILDGPLTIGTSKPRNYEGRFMGWMRVKNALAYSRNIPAIRAFLMAGGEDVVLKTASDAGITSPLLRRERYEEERGEFTYGWPLAIGSAEIPLKEMVQGYATIANDGQMQELRSVLEIVEAEDEADVIPLPEASPLEGLDRETAQELREILSNPGLRPTGGWRRMLDTGAIETAAKTGTSNQCMGIDLRTGQCALRLPSDTWTLGFSPGYVVGVWGGNATYAPLKDKADGLNVAAPIWREFMIGAHELYPELAHTFDPVDPRSAPVRGSRTAAASTP